MKTQQHPTTCTCQECIHEQEKAKELEMLKAEANRRAVLLRGLD